jgi:hypothetical protein
MGRVLTRGNRTVVAVNTLADYKQMIDDDNRTPHRGRVTSAAVIAAVNMRVVLSYRNGTIVTILAGANDFVMIDRVCGLPGNG